MTDIKPRERHLDEAALQERRRRCLRYLRRCMQGVGAPQEVVEWFTPRNIEVVYPTLLVLDGHRSAFEWCNPYERDREGLSQAIDRAETLMEMERPHHMLMSAVDWSMVPLSTDPDPGPRYDTHSVWTEAFILLENTYG